MMIKICSKVEDGDENDDEDDDDHDDDLGPGSSANVQAVQQVIFINSRVFNNYFVKHSMFIESYPRIFY